MAKRDPLQVDPLFRIKIIDLQHKLKEKSIRELTKKIASNTQLFNEIEKQLLNKVVSGDIKLKFDRRKG